MSQYTVLVIDDSATIRKLVDTQLTAAGYRVVLASNAEQGLEMAADVSPDLVLLDHQLPGTTGHNVATQLAEADNLCHIPVVISSTLRKKAYAEYLDLDNVVDMLPKPYTEDLLQTTIANAIETAAMIVNSQTQGGAVPEIINELDEAALTGNLACFGLRELLDFLNNGRKAGVCEVEAERMRFRIHLEKGRIQGVYAPGIDPSEVAEIISHLPESLVSLAPVLKMTIGGRSCAEVDGFVQLLDQKVLDPRLMSRLLRFQAAMLIRMAFTQPLTAFRFEAGRPNTSLNQRLPLDISLLALLVEGAMHGDSAEEAPAEENVSFVRRAIRGQNLDRAGLSARHMKLLNVLAEPKDIQQLVATLGWTIDEVRQVLQAFELAELIERRAVSTNGQFVVYEPDANFAQSLRSSLEDSDNRYAGKVVRDKLALKLVLKRLIPHTLVFAGDDDSACAVIERMFATTDDPRAAQIKRIALASEESASVNWMEKIGFEVDETVNRPCAADQLFAVMDRLLAEEADHSHAAQTEDFGQHELVTAGIE